MGWGRVNKRKVFVTADDFSVRGGHADGGIQGKAAYGEVSRVRLLNFPPCSSCQQTIARRARAPIVRSLPRRFNKA